MATTSDPYALLGVPRGATQRQIKAAHRALAKRYHPDSPTADAKRFLRVQEAYQLLADPLRRREWDARNAPLRADQPLTPAARARRAPAAARRAAADPPREQASRSYTWSASEVPWWEEGAREGRRAARARRAGAARPAAAEPPRDEPPVAADGPDEPPPPRNDFDVYSRSSGAAWSSAARAYFRRVDQDLPRRGSFHRQGSQPLTAARARAAAEEEARRTTEQAKRAPRAEHARAEGTAFAGASERTVGVDARETRARPAAGEAARRSASFGVSQPAYAYAGVAHDAEEITAVRQMARERERAARWPSTGQRIRFALLAWLPIALLVGYAAPHALGCVDSGSCGANMALGQALTASAALALMLALPRVAYVLGVGSAGVMLAGGAALLLAWLMGVRPPQAATLPGWALAGFAVVLVGAYLVAGTWLLSDRRRLPWVGPPSARP